MPRGSRGGRRPTRNAVRGYTIRGKYGKINYVGTTNNPGRRAAEHKSEGKPGQLKTETPSMSRKAAEQWEAKKLGTYRSSHGGKNPTHNRTKRG